MAQSGQMQRPDSSFLDPLPRFIHDTQKANPAEAGSAPDAECRLAGAFAAAECKSGETEAEK